MSTHLPPRPPMRAGDTIRVVAIGSECVVARLELLAGLADHPKCILESFLAFGPRLSASLAPPPDLVTVDDDLTRKFSGETSIERLRDIGYDGAIAILGGAGRSERKHELVRAGAMYCVPQDELNLASFLETIDMAMAVHNLMRARRRPKSQETDEVTPSTDHGEDRRHDAHPVVLARRG